MSGNVRRLLRGVRSVVGTNGLAAGVTETQSKLDRVVERLDAAPRQEFARLMELVRALSARFDAFRETSELMDHELADRVASVEAMVREIAAKVDRMAHGSHDGPAG